jgi:c-di-GMP-binding flagellar brake protein YcgR
MGPMRVWTNTTFRALDLLGAPAAAEERETPVVGAILAAAVAARLPLVLSRYDPGTRPLPIDATLQAADDTSIAIGRPLYRPGQRSLAPGERLQVRFQLDGGTYVGFTTVIARFEPGEGQIGYRLAVPETLVFDDRRRAERVAIAFQSPPPVEVLNAPTHRPIAQGSLVDLAIGGARVRTTTNAVLRAGDRVVLRAKLHDQMRIHTLGIVVHAGPSRDGQTDIGVRFTTEVPELDRYLREIVAQRSARSAAAPTE